MSPRLCALALVVPVMLAALDARADETRRAIVLPTQLGGFIPNRQEVQKAIEVLIENRLRRVRYAVASAEALSPDELHCNEDACLATIGAKHGADVVVATRLINDEQKANAYHLFVRMFVRGDKPLRSRAKDCPYCSENKATETLAVMVAKTLAGEPEEATPPIAPQQPPKTPEQSVSTTKKALRGTSIASAVAGVVLMSVGGWKASQNGEVICDPECKQRDTTPAQATLFTLGTALVVAAIPMAVFGWKSSAGVERKVSVLPAGAGMQLRLNY